MRLLLGSLVSTLLLACGSADGGTAETTEDDFRSSPSACALGDLYSALEDGEVKNFRVESTKTIKPEDVATLPAYESTQLAHAFDSEFSIDSDLADSIRGTDDGEILQSKIVAADGRVFYGYKWYGGDNPVGAVYHGESTFVAATNGDDSLDCAVSKRAATIKQCAALESEAQAVCDDPERALYGGDPDASVDWKSCLQDLNGKDRTAMAADCCASARVVGSWCVGY